jgi:hypothetical protein
VRRLLYILLVLFFLIRHDLWFWDESRTVLALPAGLAYHVSYCLAASVLMALIVRFAWPRRSEDE